MAAAFNLTAQINLRGPRNTRAIASQMRKQLSGVKVKVDLDLKGASAKNVANINKQLQGLSRNAAIAHKNVARLNQSVVQLGAGLKGIGAGSVQSIAKVQKQVNNAGKSIDTATSQIQEFGKQSGLAIRRFAAFSAVTGVVYGLTNAINSAYKEFVQFDRQLIRLSQVTGTSVAGLQGITKEITSLSTNLGVASTDLMQISVTLAQAGLSAQEAKTALEALAKSSLAPSFDNLNDTVEGSIALMKQFSISSTDLEAALGSVNAVAASFAVEAGDIIKAIQRTGGVFASASKGVSTGTQALNEFVALFTSVRSTTREGAETIATGLRTIFTRIQRGSTIESLKEFGITLTDLEGKFVGPFEAVKRLSQGLSGLDPRDLRFGQIVEELGGFRQIGKVIPLIQQFATAQKALGVAQSGQGSLSKAAIQAQASLAVQFEKTRQSFVGLIREIGDSTTFRTIATVSLTTANAFISLAGALKPLLPMLTALTAIKGASILSEFGSGFLGGVGKSGGGGGGGGGGGLGGLLGGGKGPKGSGGGRKGSPASLKANTAALAANTSTMAELIASMQNLNSMIAGMSGGSTKAFASGGLVPGSGNRDTVSAKLTPGEYVIRKKAVEKIGADKLSKLNRGGMIQKFFTGGGVEELAQQRGVSATDIIAEEIQNAKSIKNVKQLAGIDPRSKFSKSLNNILRKGVYDDPNNPEALATAIDVINKVLAKKAGDAEKLEGEKAVAPSYALVGLRGKPADHFMKAEDGTMVNLIGRRAKFGRSYDKQMREGFIGTVQDVAGSMAQNIGGGTKVKIPDKKGLARAGLYNAIGAYLEAAVASIGAPYDKDQSNDPLDFEKGLGPAASMFGVPSDMPADTTRTVFGKGKSPAKFLDQVNRYRKNRMATGGSVEDTVPALLTPGEYVLNKKAAQKLGSQKLDKLNKADKIQGFNKGGAVGFVQRFAAGGGVQADQAAYVARMAKKLGMTVEKYEKSIRNRILNQAEKQATSKTGAQTDLLDVLVKNIESIGDADVENLVRGQAQELVEKIYGGADQIDPDVLSDSIDDLVASMKSGLSIEEIKASSSQWAETLDMQINASGEVAKAQENMAKKLGFLSSGMKTKDIDIRARQSLNEGKFGSFDKMNLRKAQTNIESGFGSILDNIGQKLSTANIPGMNKLSKAFPDAANKITSIGDKMGGLTGILGSGATILSTQLPKMFDSFDKLTGSVSDHSETLAGVTGALRSGGSFGMSGAILGQQAFGRRGAAIGGAAGLAGGAISGFIKESTARELENAMRGVTAASSNLDKTLGRLDMAQTIEERQELVQQLNRDYENLNQALNQSAQEIEKNRIWNALSSGLEGFMTSLSTVIGFMAAAKISAAASSFIPKGKATGGSIGFNTGGMVPVKLASGEGVFTPPLPTSISNLKKMNQADRNGYKPNFATGGMGIVPGSGSGEVDNYDTMLPEGSYVIRAKAMKSMQAATGGRIGSSSVGVKGYASGGGVQGYFLGGLIRPLVQAGFRTIGPTITKAIVKGFSIQSLKSLVTSQAGIYTALSLIPAAIQAGFGFFDTTATDQQLAAQLASLEQLRKLVDIQTNFVVKDQKSSQRLLSRMDPVERANLTTEQRQAMYASPTSASGDFNELNILGSRQARAKLSGAGFDVGQGQGIQEYLDSLNSNDRQAAEELVIEANQELAKRIYLEARQREGIELSTARKEFESSDPETQAKVKKRINEELGSQNRRIALARRMMIVNRQLQKFTLSLTDVMNRLGSTMQRVTSEIVSSTNRLSQLSSEFTGETVGAANPSEKMAQTLSNITAYSAQELARVVDGVNSSLGNTKETRQMGDLIKGLQIIQKELPLILRDTAEGGDLDAGAESSIRDRLDTMFAGVDIGKNIKKNLEDSIINYITDSTGNRQGMSYEDLANNIEGLKELDAAAEKARSTFEDYANKQIETNRLLGGVSNQLASQLDKLKDNVIKVRDIQLQSALQLADKFNKTVSLSDLNSPFNNSVKGLTGGTTDAAEIGRIIAEAIEQKRMLEADPATQTSALGAGQIAKLTSKINRYQRALGLLADSTDKASNALRKIDEQQRISAGRRTGVMDFLSNINNPEALLGMRRDQVSYSNVMSGTGTINDIAQGISQLRLVENTQTPEDFARTQEAFFNNAMGILESSGGNPEVFRQFKEMFAADFGPQGQNPAISPFVDAFNQASEQQIKAATEQSRLITNGAEIAADALRKGADDFTSKLKVATDAIVAELNGVADRLGLGQPSGSQTFANGGVVYASAGQMINFQPKGTDTVPAMLTPGEFVVNRASTSKNLPLLKSINSGGYSRGGSVSYYDQGGYVSTSGSKFGGAQSKLDRALEADFEKVIGNILSKQELAMEDTGYYQVQKNFLPGNRRMSGKMTNIQSAMDFFNNLDRGLRSTNTGGDFRSIEKLDVFKETIDRITNKDLRSILGKDNKLVSAINPYLKSGKENSWWSFTEGWGKENKKYQGNLSDARTTIETLGPKLDAYSDIMGGRISELPGLKQVVAKDRSIASRRKIPQLEALQKRKGLIDGLIDLRAFGSGIEDTASIRSLYGKGSSSGYSNDIKDLIKTGLLPEEILDKGAQEGVRKGMRNAAIGLGVGSAIAAAPFTGGASLASLGLMLGGTMVGSGVAIKVADMIEERQFQKLKNSDPLTYEKMKALRDNENFKSTASTWEGLVDIADVAVSTGPGVAKFLRNRGSQLMKSISKPGALGMVDDAVSPGSKKFLDDILGDTHSPNRSKSKARGKSKSPSDIMRMTDDVRSMIANIKGQRGSELAESFSKSGSDNLEQNVRNALDILGVSSEDFYKVLPNQISVADNLSSGALGFFRANQGAYADMGEIAIKRSAHAKVLYHEMTHSMMDQIRKQRPEAWTRYQGKVKSVFSGKDPHKLGDAITSLSKSYQPADMMFGRYYKARRLNQLVKQHGKGTYPKITKRYPEIKKFLDDPGNYNQPYDGATDAIMNGALRDLGASPAELAWDAGAGMEEFLTKLVDNANDMSNKQRKGLGGILDDLLMGPPPPPISRNNSALKSLDTPNKLTVMKQSWSRFTKPIRRFMGDDPDIFYGSDSLPVMVENLFPSTVGGGVLAGLLAGAEDIYSNPTAGSSSASGGSASGGSASGGSSGGSTSVPPASSSAGGSAGGSAGSSGAQEAIEQHLEETRRVFATTNASLLDATGGEGIGEDNSRYSFGQAVQGRNKGLVDPLDAVNYYARRIRIPEFELGGTSEDGSVDAGNLLTQSQREVYESQYYDVLNKIKSLYKSADGSVVMSPDPAKLSDFTNERDSLKEVLDSDYRAQFNLGQPTKEPKFNLASPTQPNSSPPSDAEKMMLQDDVPKDNKRLLELMSHIKTGTTTKTNEEILKPFGSRFTSVGQSLNEALKPGSKLDYQKQVLSDFNKLKADYLKAYAAPQDVTATNIGFSSSTSGPSSAQKAIAELNLLKDDHKAKLEDPQFKSSPGGLPITPAELNKVNDDVNSLVAKYQGQYGQQSPADLKDILQKATERRDLLRIQHGDWDKYYTQRKEYDKKRLEFEFLQKRWDFRDEIKADPEGRMSGGGQFGMGSLEYALFNHPRSIGAVNPFEKFDKDAGKLYGKPATDLASVMGPINKTTNKTIENLIKNYGQALGINPGLPIPKKSSDMDTWLSNINPDAVSLMDSSVPNPGWMLDILENQYALGMEPNGKTLASKFGLWSVVGAKNGWNSNFGKDYEEAFQKRVRKKLQDVYELKGKRADTLDGGKVSTQESIIDSLATYSGLMNPAVYRAGNPAFGPLIIPKNNANIPDDKKVAKYRKDIGRAVQAYTKSNFDMTFGGRTSVDGYQAIADRLGIPLDGEALRETVLTDRNALKRIKEGRTFAVGRAGLGTDGAKQSTGIANLFAAGRSAEVPEGDRERFTDLDGNVEKSKTILGLLASGLNFDNRLGITNRQSRLDYVKDFKFADLLQDPIYAKYEEKHLDPSIEALKPVYKLWDSLKNYFVKDGLTTARIIDENASGVISKTQKSENDTFLIGGKQIAATDFLNSYASALSAGKDPYSLILEGGSILNDANKDGGAFSSIVGKPTPFNNKEFILSKKEIQMQDPLNRAKGGSIPNYFSGGGSTLVNYQAKGTDTVPAMLTPGEFVINRAATQKHLPLLKSINNGSMPSSISGTTYARSGGVIQARNYFDGGLGKMGNLTSGGLGLDLSSAEGVFNTFIRNFSSETSAFGGLINNLARVFPALSGPVNNFGNHVDKLVNALNGLKNIEIKGPNIPDTINVNSETIRVELIAPQDSNYKLSDDDRRQITQSLETRLKELTTLGR